MRRTILAAVLGGLLIPAAAHAGAPWPETKPYVAGSVGFDVTAGQVSANNAFGPVNCDTGTGGNCFDVTGHENEFVFTVTAEDEVSGTVGIFMGFDMDGDGCVGCGNGNGPPGSPGNPDLFWQGADRVDGFMPFSPDGTPPGTLFVFTRIATLQTGDLGTTGTLTIGPCKEGCNPQMDTQMGTVCTDNRKPPEPGRKGCGGEEIRGMYPYPRVP